LLIIVILVINTYFFNDTLELVIQIGY